MTERNPTEALIEPSLGILEAAAAPSSGRQAMLAGGVSAEKLRELRHVGNVRGAWDIMAGLASFAAVPIIFSIKPYPIVFGICLLLAIRNFNYIGQIVHESAHGTLLRSSRLNDAAGSLAALMLGYTRSGYRQAHIDHHLYLNTAKDPDWLFGLPRQTGRDMLLLLLQDLFLVTAIKRLLQYSATGRGPSSTVPWRAEGAFRFIASFSKRMLPVAIMQLAILLVFTTTAGPWFYLWFHLIPLMTLYPFQIRMRSAAEHGFEAVPSENGPTWMSRTGRLRIGEMLILAPLDLNHHYEHHLFPSIPNRHLPLLQRELTAAGISIPTHRSYIGFTFRKIWADLR